MKTAALRPARAEDRLIVAADVPDEKGLEKLLSALAGRARWMKIGAELFTALGPAALLRCKRAGLKIFLDLKFHDIPRTVGAAVKSSLAWEVDMLTVHASGGPEMIAAAREAALGAARPPLVVAVTVLTSLDDQKLHRIGFGSDTAAAVEHLSGLALEAGADGLVCSAREVARLRAAFGERPLLVVPGIRPAGEDKGDQARVATAGEAAAAGADFLVVGRPICSAPNPAAALESILRQIPSS
jgi:orotidine-5'-phosphate decarboxylase